MSDVVITLSLARKSGILAAAVLALSRAGLQFKSHRFVEAEPKHGIRLAAESRGPFGDPRDVIDALSSIRGVESVVDVEVDGRSLLHAIPKSRPEPKSRLERKPRPESKPEPRPEPKPEPRPEPKPEPRLETDPGSIWDLDAENESTLAPEPETAPLPEPEPEPESRSESAPKRAVEAEAVNSSTRKKTTDAGDSMRDSVLNPNARMRPSMVRRRRRRR